MKIPVTYKGNTFICTLHDCRDEGNGEKGYIAFVDIFKGCVTSTPNNNFRELEKQVRSAIKDWLEPTSLNVAQRQRHKIASDAFKAGIQYALKAPTEGE